MVKVGVCWRKLAIGGEWLGMADIDGEYKSLKV